MNESIKTDRKKKNRSSVYRFTREVRGEVNWDREWELLFQTSRRRRGSQLRISEVIKSPEMEQNKGGELISRNLYRTCWENSLTCRGNGEMHHGSFPFRIRRYSFLRPNRFELLGPFKYQYTSRRRSLLNKYSISHEQFGFKQFAEKVSIK